MVLICNVWQPFQSNPFEHIAANHIHTDTNTHTLSFTHSHLDLFLICLYVLLFLFYPDSCRGFLQNLVFSMDYLSHSSTFIHNIHQISFTFDHIKSLQMCIFVNITHFLFIFVLLIWKFDSLVYVFIIFISIPIYSFRLFNDNSKMNAHQQIYWNYFFLSFSFIVMVIFFSAIICA